MAELSGKSLDDALKQAYSAQLDSDLKAAYADAAKPLASSGAAMSLGGEERALRVGVEKGATFGARPAIAGVGGALGSFVGNLQQGKGLGESFDQGVNAYSDARNEAIKEQGQLSQDYPKSSLVGELGGSILTAPLTPIRSLLGAVKLGAAAGVGQAVGESKDLTDAGIKIGGGAALGAGGYGAGKVVGAAYDKLKDVAKSIFPAEAAAKIASAATGVSTQDILTYARETDAINKLNKQYNGNVPEAVDAARQVITGKIQTAKKILSNQISEALGSVEGKVDVAPIISKLEEVQSDMHPITKMSERGQINGMINVTRNISGETKDKLIQKGGLPEFDINDNGDLQSLIHTVESGEAGKPINVKDLFALKEYLADKSKKAFLKNGDIFLNDKDVARAAKAGYFEAKNMLDSLSPEIREANKKYHQLHVLEDAMNPNLLALNKPEGPFLAATTGDNRRNNSILSKLGDVTNQDIIQQGKNASAMSAFGSPSLLPSGPKTGYILGRFGLGSAIGAGASASQDGDWKAGAVAGAALTSPTALKGMINAGNMAGKLTTKGFQLLNDPTVRSAVIQQLNSAANNENNSMKRKLENRR